jgi:hypothetical protein
MELPGDDPFGAAEIAEPERLVRVPFAGEGCLTLYEVLELRQVRLQLLVMSGSSVLEVGAPLGDALHDPDCRASVVLWLEDKGRVHEGPFQANGLARG